MRNFLIRIWWVADERLRCVGAAFGGTCLGVAVVGAMLGHWIAGIIIVIVGFAALASLWIEAAAIDRMYAGAPILMPKVEPLRNFARPVQGGWQPRDIGDAPPAVPPHGGSGVSRP